MSSGPRPRHGVKWVRVLLYQTNTLTVKSDLHNATLLNLLKKLKVFCYVKQYQQILLPAVRLELCRLRHL